MAAEINVDALDFASIDDTEHVVYYNAGFRKVGALSQFPVYGARYLYSSYKNLMLIAVSYHQFTLATSFRKVATKNETVAGPFQSQLVTGYPVNFYMYLQRFTGTGGLLGGGDITYEESFPSDVTGVSFEQNTDFGYKLLTGYTPSGISINYYPINSILTGPNEANRGDNVVVNVSFPDGYKLKDAEQGSGISVYNDNGYIDFSYSDGVLTFTMPS